MIRTEYLVFGNAYNKVASVFMISAERFGIITPKGVVFDFMLTHKLIASLVGVSRETSRI